MFYMLFTCTIKTMKFLHATTLAIKVHFNKKRTHPYFDYPMGLKSMRLIIGGVEDYYPKLLK